MRTYVYVCVYIYIYIERERDDNDILFTKPPLLGPPLSCAKLCLMLCIRGFTSETIGMQWMLKSILAGLTSA